MVHALDLLKELVLTREYTKMCLDITLPIPGAARSMA